MKVRLTESMIRIRVDQPDVETLAETGEIGFAIPLAHRSSLHCWLVVRANAPEVKATGGDGEIRIVLPRNRAHAWIESDAVSLEAQIDAGGTSTRILVEKDLGCRHGEEEAATKATFDHLRADDNGSPIS